MSLPEYQKYRPSGVEWLGDVPEHWQLRRVRLLFAIKKRIAGDLGLDVFSITQNGIRIKDLESNDGQMSMDYSKYQLVERGDFAMNPMDLLTGGVDIAQSRGVTSPDYRVVELTDPGTCDARYFLYLYQTLYRRHIFYAYGQGSAQLGRWRLPTDQFRDLIFPIPPKTEQEGIASFLDREVVKIDTLVAEQRRLIELLKEKRQAVISLAVTKGLTRHVSTKPSGVEWLGEVPQHWQVKQLRHIATVLRGKFTHRPRNDPAFYDGDFPFIQTGDITGAGRFITRFKQTLNERGIAVSKQFPKGTLVMAIAANIGDVAILNFPAYFPDSMVGLVPKQGIDLTFLYHLMVAMKQPMMMTATINTQMNLNVDQICSLTAPCPPQDEQQRIAIQLDDSLAQTDELIVEAERAIELLQDRRTALISAAVTGQIDVRGFVPLEAA